MPDRCRYPTETVSSPRRSPALGAALSGTLVFAACSGTRAGGAPGGDSGYPVIDAPEVADAPDGVDAPPPCNDALPAEPAQTPFALRFDQVGYAPGTAWAVLLGSGQAAPRYRLYLVGRDCFVGDGAAGPRVVDTTSRAGSPLTGDRVDLAALREPGEYLLVLPDGARLGPVRIAEAPYAASLAHLVR